MATVIQPTKQSSYWIAVCTLGSKRVWKTTKVPIEPLAGRDEKPDGSLPTRQELKEKAELFAYGIERALRAEQEGTATESNLRAIFSEILQRTEGKSLTTPSVQGWLADWLASRRAIVTPGTLIKYQQIRREFLNSLGKQRAGTRLDVISQSDIIRFRDRLLESGRSAATVNQYLNVLSTPFDLAFKQGLIRCNPLAGVSHVKSDHVEKGVFTPEEVAELLKVAPIDWQGVILIGYFTGVRLSDITNLRWENVDLAKRRIRFVARKTGKPVELPMHPELEDFLLHKLPSSDDPKAFLFPTLAGKKTSSKSGLSNSFSRLMEKAGVEAGEARAKKGEAGRFRSLRSFHSLRHTFNSAMANAGIPQEVRQKLTGHASAKMNSHYTHHEFEVLRQAVNSVSRL